MSRVSLGRVAHQLRAAYMGQDKLDHVGLGEETLHAATVVDHIDAVNAQVAGEYLYDGLQGGMGHDRVKGILAGQV